MLTPEAWCPAHSGQRVDAGPDCCDLSCLLGPDDARTLRQPLRWEGDDA